MTLDDIPLRWILAGLGVLLVLGIYLWDRYKRSSPSGGRLKMGRNLPELDFEVPDRDDDVSEVRVRGRSAQREPFLELPLEPDSEPHSDETELAAKTPVHKTTAPVAKPASVAPEARASQLEPGTAQESATKPTFASREQASESDTESVEQELDWAKVKAEQDEPFSFDFGDFSSPKDNHDLNIDPDLLAQAPSLIVQIGIMSAGSPFSIAQIRKATSEVDLIYGEMNIYHRQTDAGHTLFSMASVVEPGTFPAAAGESFSTPGMLLFTQLPSVQDGLAIYSDMLFTAERLATLLDAKLHDEKHNILTKQAIEHTREAILEHRRQMQLLRSRR